MNGRRNVWWSVLIIIGMFAVACTPTEEQGANEQSEGTVAMKETSDTPPNADAEIGRTLEEMFRWYIGRPDEARIATTYNDAEMAIIENKASFLDALRESTYFSEGFVNRLEAEYNACEQEFGAEELDEHLPCLERDPVTVRAGFDQFSALEVVSLSQSEGQAVVQVTLKGEKQLTEDATQSRSASLKITLLETDGKWLTDQISDHE
ncbi:MAG: hypothetical protein AAF998_09770 [Bacteroidota bacterium]